MQHAVEILEERECELRAWLRKSVDDPVWDQEFGSQKRYEQQTQQLAEVREALRLLRLQSVPAA